MQIRIAIVEDDDGIRASLSSMINRSSSCTLVSSYPDAESALADLPRHKPQVVLMDINLPRMDGVECVRRLRMTMTDTQFIMLTVYEDSERLFKSLMVGASGYLLKRTPSARLLQAIREVYEGGSPMTPQIARRVVLHFLKTSDSTSEMERLTVREKAILDQLSRGFQYKEIVCNLNISIGTVRGYIRNIYKKLEVHSRTEAVVKYLNR
jgi:DNA-binding NarL/FixJ family response regulator